MKQSKTCPKCSSSEVYTNANVASRGDRCVMAGGGNSMKGRLFIDVVVCIECGYFEEYVEAEDLANQKKMDLLKGSWRKLG